MSEPRGSALIYILPGVYPATIFTGRTLLERAFALAEAAGLEPLVVDTAGPGAVGRDGPRLGARPGDPLPLAAGTVVLLRCDVACVAGALRDLVAADHPQAVYDDAGRLALVCTTVAMLGGAIPPDLAVPADAAVASRAGWLGRRRILALDFANGGRPAHETAARRERVEADLLASLENPRDGSVDRVLNRHLSRPLSQVLMPFAVTPNQVTVFALLLALVGAGCIALPGVAWPVFGALLLQLTAILDCVDGEIARAKVLETELGEWLDITADTLIHVATFLGIAVHAWPTLGGDTAWLLGGLFTFGGFASFLVVTRAERTEEIWLASATGEARLLAGLLATLTTRDTSVLVLAAAAADLLTPLLIGAAFGAQVFWIGTLALHTRAMRRVA